MGNTGWGQPGGERRPFKKNHSPFILPGFFCRAVSVCPLSFSLLTFIGRENPAGVTLEQSSFPTPAKRDSKPRRRLPVMKY